MPGNLTKKTLERSFSAETDRRAISGRRPMPSMQHEEAIAAEDRLNANRHMTSLDLQSLHIHLQVQTSPDHVPWIIELSLESLYRFDRQLHQCVFDRKYSLLPELCIELLTESNSRQNSGLQDLHQTLSRYFQRLSAIAFNMINCGAILSWFEMDNRGNRATVSSESDSAINIPAVGAALVVRRYVAQAPDEISLEVGEIISLIDMPPTQECSWWREKRNYKVGFFPAGYVESITGKVPECVVLSRVSVPSQSVKPVLWTRGKFIVRLRAFFSSRTARSQLKQWGIMKERVFGCDLGEHVLNSGHAVSQMLKFYTDLIETHGFVDGIYRLSGIVSNIQKLRCLEEVFRTRESLRGLLRPALDVLRAGCLVSESGQLVTDLTGDKSTTEHCESRPGRSLPTDAAAAGASENLRRLSALLSGSSNVGAKVHRTLLTLLNKAVKDDGILSALTQLTEVDCTCERSITSLMLSKCNHSWFQQCSLITCLNSSALCPTAEFADDVLQLLGIVGRCSLSADQLRCLQFLMSCLTCKHNFSTNFYMHLFDTMRQSKITITSLKSAESIKTVHILCELARAMILSINTSRSVGVEYYPSQIVLPSDLYVDFKQTAIQDEDYRLLRMHDVIQQLPPPHYRTDLQSTAAVCQGLVVRNEETGDDNMNNSNSGMSRKRTYNIMERGRWLDDEEDCCDCERYCEKLRKRVLIVPRRRVIDATVEFDLNSTGNLKSYSGYEFPCQLSEEQKEEVSRYITKERIRDLLHLRTLLGRHITLPIDYSGERFHHHCFLEEVNSVTDVNIISFNHLGVVRENRNFEGYLKDGSAYLVIYHHPLRGRYASKCLEVLHSAIDNKSAVPIYDPSSANCETVSHKVCIGSNNLSTQFISIEKNHPVLAAAIKLFSIGSSTSFSSSRLSGSPDFASSNELPSWYGLI